MAVQSNQDLILFTGTMDADTEKRFIKPGDYLMLKNARSAITNGQNYGAIEDGEGNLLVANGFLNSVPGTNKTIGSYEDVAGQSIIYCVYNSAGYHGIFRWYYNRPGITYGEIQKIWQVKDPSIYNEYNKNPLNFNPDYLITGITLVDNLLFLNDYYNEPKQIDVVRANETRKFRKYDFFINQLELTNSINYTIRVVSPATVIVETITVTSVFVKLEDRVEDVCNQINALINSNIKAVNKTYWIELVLQRLGEYTLQYNDTGLNQSRILPNNFYVHDIPGNFFNKIQAPPFCRPDANYIPLGWEAPPLIPSGVMNNFPFTSFNSDLSQWFYVGWASHINDPDNIITPGPNGVAPPGLPPFTSVFNPPSYIFSPSNITVYYEFVLTINNVWDQFQSRVQLFFANVSPTGVVNAQIPIASFFSGSFNPSFPHVITIPSTQLNLPNYSQGKWIILGRLYEIDFTITGGSITIGSNATSIIPGIEKQSCMFRNRYEYENFQKTVYGQATSIILRTEGYPLQYEIELDFNDKFISTDTYASRLKKVILSYSKDGGTTWYDYEEKDKYDFICENTSIAIFNNKKLNIPVDPALAILQFHSVPLKAKSLEYADNRLFDGGIVEGYNTINVDFDVDYYYTDYILNSYYTGGTIPISIQGFKPGYSGYIGIVYYDDFDRKSAVCISPNSKIDVPYYPTPAAGGSSIASNAYVWGLKLKIFNEPPSWATKYRLVRTRDFSQTSYLMWMIDAIETVDFEGNVTAINPKYYKIYLDNIPFYTTTSNRGAIIEYTYVVGDRIKLVADENGDYLADPFDLRIEQAETNAIYVLYDPLIVIDKEYIIEIYSQGQQEDPGRSLYYEMGECFEIKTADFGGILKKYHTGNDTTQSVVDQQYFLGMTYPASLVTNNGGVYYRMRSMYYDVTTAAQQKDVWINSDYADEYDNSKFDGLTRPNSVSRIGEISLPPAMRVSNPYISGTEINGLNEYEPLNLEKYSTDYGLMIKMKLVNNDIIKLIFSNSYQMSIYVSQGVIKQVQGTSNLITVIDAIAGNSHIIQRSLGSVNPESVALNDEGDLFGWDENEGVVWRASGNGVIQISDYKQKTRFKNWSNERKACNRIKSQTPSVYNIYHDEYILTLNQIEGGQPEILPSVNIDLINVSKGAYDINVYIEETGLQVIPIQSVPAGTDLMDYIESAFLAIGWTSQTQTNGSITFYAPDFTFANQNIVVNITTSSYLTGPNLITNGIFLWPNGNYDWLFDSLNWNINPYNNPGSPIGNSYLYHVAGPGATGAATQSNIGLEVGQQYEVILDLLVDVNPSDLFIVLGDGANETVGTVYTASGTQLTELLTFNDPLNDIVQIKTSIDLSELKITNLSIKKVFGTNFSSKFKLSSGQGYIQEPTAIPATIVFNKQKNGWTEFFDFIPEYYGRLNDAIVAFKNGQLWLFHPDATPKNYFGVQYARELTLITNGGFPKVKSYKAISINGAGLNSVPLLKIPAYQGTTEMNSELTEVHFSVKEGIQYADIQKDKLDPTYTDPNLAWVNGRNMRGQYMEVTIVNDKPETSVIYSVDILYFYSENS